MSGYNQKIIRSGSYVEIWEYEKPIFIEGALVENCSTEQVDEGEKKNGKRRSFEELSEDEQQERLNRMNKTRLEAKWKLLRLVDSNFCDNTSFLTLTTKENIRDRNEFISNLKTFIKRFNYHVYDTKKSKLRYLAVLERQKRGAWHSHLLLFEVPFIPHKVLLKLWRHGAVRINKLDHLDDSTNAGRYVVKYMEKGIGQELLENFGKKAYLSSRNLKRPEETKLLLKDSIELDEESTLYETEYVSKKYRNGRLVDNPVKYKKIKINDNYFKSN
ncbi:hypothetical protein J2T56_003195 [Natronobacillus azotifigens]|uniref:Rep protein n=1 Tax=Natronobacillus azotifigens TaxID=472978 RepID=A0A9J6RGN2_9BACI|nr:Rep protein [Natronobacillus azotifigens]MCZ0704606.1 Rep protein [Natronobacillus azotifigens]